MYARENKGTERDIEGVGWDMSIPLKLFLVLDGNGNLFPEPSAIICFHYFAFTKNIRSRLALMRTSRKTDLRSRAHL